MRLLPETLLLDHVSLNKHEHAEDERAHYAKYAFDIQYEAPFGWSEFEGIHYRGDYDLKNHNLSYKDQQTGEEFIPWVIETSGGVDRAMLFFLIDAYSEDGERIVLKLNSKIAPYKVAVFPLLANKQELAEKAREIYLNLKSLSLSCIWDDRGNIGKRYFAQDEIGTPWCVTVDFDSLRDKKVTVRDRDSAKQERIAISKLENYFKAKLQ
ncbi:MAG: Glycine-tRNA ligase [Candidatus Levybacteria bacterium GW2011_GWA1_39_32]|nr:MAG: Glycine-tRNA ligase [Candidatus Levybacteria bacterium GW2011_GWA1_39_32]